MEQQGMAGAIPCHRAPPPLDKVALFPVAKF
jgi:hypothetical protein